MIAFARSNAPGHHHFSWDVGTVDEIGVGAMHMFDKGFTKGWGLGRHVLGSNFFHYVQDPWGSFCEYSADIDYVPADCDWPAGDHPPDRLVLSAGDRPFRKISCTTTRPEAVRSSIARYEPQAGNIAIRRRPANRGDELEQALATILFVDIVRSTEKAARLGEV